MTSTEGSNKTGGPLGDSEDEVLAAMDKRTRKLVVGITAIFAPAELILTLTQHSANTLEQNLSLLIVVLLVFTYQRHTAALAGQLDNSERLFRLLVSPFGRVVYFLFGAASLLVIGGNLVSMW